MQNGWGGGPPSSQGATTLSQWPPASPAGVIGGRGRGFAPGRGRGLSWSQAQSSSPGPSVNGHRNNDGGGKVGIPYSERRSCFKCGSQSHLSHSCTGIASPPKITGKTLQVNGHGTHQDDEEDSGISSPRDSHLSGDHDRWGDVASRNPPKHNQRNVRNNNFSQVSCFKCGKDGHKANFCRSRDNRDKEQKETRSKSEKIEAEQSYKPEESLEEHLYDHGVSSGINFKKYKSIPVTVTGSDVPDKIESFEDANLDPLLLANISKSKYLEPTPIQEYAVPIVLAGRDVMACAQTGSGKTAAFLVPIIESLLRDNVSPSRGGNVQVQCAFPEVVVMSPTRELAGQIKDEARKFCNGSSIRCLAAYGGTSVQHLADQLEHGCNILVATPGRLNDFVARGRLSFRHVRFLVLDEADRMLDMGFKDDMIKILMSEEMTPVGKRQTLLFSATYPKDIQQIAQSYLHNYLMINVGIVGSACADVAQDVVQVSQFEKREKLLEILTKAKTLVFVENKKTADFIASYLCQTNHAATSIHGDRLQPEREKALKDFKSDLKPILVATAVAARGLDIRGVAHVINYDLPKTIEEYVHRIGRTGRLGNTGMATSFYDSKADSGIAAGLVQVLADSQQEVPNWLEKEGKENPAGFHGSQGARFGARDIRNQDAFLPSNQKPTEEDETWNP